MRLASAACALGLAAGSLAVVGATGGPAYACSCAQVDRTVLAQRASAVFVGTVTARAPEGTSLVLYDVTVDRVYKGEVQQEVSVSTAAHEASCGMPALPLDTELLFVTQVPVVTGRTESAGPSDQTELQINLCGGTTPVAGTVEAEVEKALGLPSEPEPLPGAEEPEPEVPSGTAEGTARDEGLPWKVGLGGVGVMAVLGLLAWLVSRRRS